MFEKLNKSEAKVGQNQCSRKGIIFFETHNIRQNLFVVQLTGSFKITDASLHDSLFLMIGNTCSSKQELSIQQGGKRTDKFLQVKISINFGTGAR
ncbi:MAG: hypothetical protein ABJN60_00910 [Parasphingorhabdus sp.]